MPLSVVLPFRTVLLDDYFPAYDARERHEIAIAAPPDVVYGAIRTADLGGHLVTRTLLAIRAAPLWWQRGRWRISSRPRARPLTLAHFEARGFVVLADRPPEEILVGLQGRFWAPSGGLEFLDAAAMRETIPAGRARAGWNFVTAPRPGGRTRLSTETRVICADVATRRRFLWYWCVIRPGSGLIRRAMLASIKRAAEARARGIADV